jgi:hypothetical protein
MPPPLHRPARPRALLIHHSAPAQPWRALVLRGPTITIGAAPACDLILDSPGVAPRHCTLHQRPRGFLLHDHGAPLGTYLDARRLLAPITLTAAATLTIGQHHLHIVPLPDPPHPGPRPASPPAPPVHLPAPPQPHLAATSPPRPLLLAGLGLCAATSALTLTLAFIALIADPPPGAFASQILSAAPALSPAAPAAPPTTTQTHPPATESTPVLTNYHPSALPQRSAHLAQARPPAPRRALRVEHGETWASLAERLGRDVNALQADNPHLRRPLRRGDRLRIDTPAAITPIHTCALPLEVPRGALAVGPVDRGRLHDAVRLPPLPIYHLRCPAHAFASSATAAQLIAAITCFRDHTGYRGELVIGDLSRESGGPLPGIAASDVTPDWFGSWIEVTAPARRSNTWSVWLGPAESRYAPSAERANARSPSRSTIGACRVPAATSKISTSNFSLAIANAPSSSHNHDRIGAPDSRLRAPSASVSTNTSLSGPASTETAK